MIAQIKLLQSACNSYCLTPEPSFLRWFKSQTWLSDEERYSSYLLVYIVLLSTTSSCQIAVSFLVFEVPYLCLSSQLRLVL